MRKIIVLSIIGLLSLNTLKAQLRYTGQWAVNANGGITLENGFDVYMGAEKYFSNSVGSLAMGVSYTRDKKFIKITDFNISSVALSVLYYYSLETIIKPPFFINIGAGILGGVENFEKKKVPDGIIQMSGSKVMYGFTIRPQFECLISKKVSFYLQPEVDYIVKTRFTHFMFKPSLGIKVYL